MDAKIGALIELYRAMENGNVALVLSMLSGRSKEEMESVLQTGKTPWEVARNVDVLEEFHRVVSGRMHTQLDFMVDTGQISRRRADEMVRCFDGNLKLREI